MKQLTPIQVNHVKSLKVTQLRSILGSLELDRWGFKADMVPRLVTFIETSVTDAQQSNNWAAVQKLVDQFASESCLYVVSRCVEL